MLIKSVPILVVGGAGYIGSHMVFALKQAGFKVVVYDHAPPKYLPTAQMADHFIQGDLADKQQLMQLFNTHSFAAVMHFASFIDVAESVKNPIKYYQNNVAATLNLFEVMLQHQVNHIIFSSSAAVYGEPQTTFITEQHPLHPITPYGRSKKIIEEVIQDLAQSDGWHYAILRYFNAAGADPSGRFGEQHEPESHLIPIVLEVAAAKQNAITIYGTDYSTPDGTCIRDYVHVTDLCAAHLSALQKLLTRQKQQILCNLGTGRGYSVAEVIQAAEQITGKNIAKIEGKRRAGDPAILVADASYAKTELNWQPQYAKLDLMIQHAWQFMQQQKEVLAI